MWMFYKNIKIKNALIEKDPACITELIEVYGKRLFHYALVNTGNSDSAQDVVQNVLVKLVRNPEVLKGIKNLKAYLYKSIKNEGINYLKINNRENFLEDLVFDVPDKKGNFEDAVMIQDALKGLTCENREVVVLKVYHNMTFQEIGQVLDIPQNTAASRYRYSIEKMKKILGGENE